MLEPPFVKESQLCDKLILDCDSGDQRIIRCREPPFRTLPGQPRLTLFGPSLIPYLQSEFITPNLDRFSPHLWLVGTQTWRHISPLHHQLVKGRQLIVTENPQLHLVWYSDRIFLKPLPEYVLSHAFWQFHLCDDDKGYSPFSEEQQRELRLAVTGFVRTYALLIQHESDFRLAQRDEHLLIPRGITFPAFVAFINHFAHVPDVDVSPRYAGFGELRLSRLNLWSKVFLSRFTFQKVHYHYSDYFAQFYGPLLFGFATLSVLLGAMQVSLAVPQFLDSWPEWAAFGRMALWWALGVQIFVVAIMVELLALLAFMVLREALYALKHRFR